MASATTSATTSATDYENFISKNEKIVYIGQVKYKEPRIENTIENKWKGKWDIEYKCSKDIQLKENGRVYFILVDDKIYKIGSSAGKGGIKTTFAFYQEVNRSHSISRIGVHILIQELLDADKEIKIYALFNDPIKVIAYGFFSANEVVDYPGSKVMEDVCRVEYKEKYGKYPPWNFQENGEKWPEYIHKFCDDFKNKGKKTTEIKIVNTGEAAKILGCKTSEIMEWKANEELPKTIGDVTIEFEGYEKKAETWKLTML
jgi:hypothetical protein